MKIQLAKKEQYRMLRTKTTIIVLGLLIVLVMIPLSDYSFYKQTPLELTGQDFLRLLSCGGGTFLGFSINYILFNVVCVGLIFHSEFVNKTFLYEKMHGISMMQSLGQRFLIVTEIVLVENIFFVVLFMVFSIKNGQPGLAIITITYYRTSNRICNDYCYIFNSKCMESIWTFVCPLSCGRILVGKCG